MSEEHLNEPSSHDASEQAKTQAGDPAVRSGKKARIYTGFGGFLLFMFALAIFFYYNFKTVEIRGDSMEPTLHNGGRLLVSNAYWLVGSIKPDDIVVIKNSAEDDVIIKRVYKISGQEVDLKNTPEGYDMTRGPYVVPEGTIYVLGDNISVSQDSRHYGPFELNDVIGKMVVVSPLLGKAAKTE